LGGDTKEKAARKKTTYLGLGELMGELEVLVLCSFQLLS